MFGNYFKLSKIVKNSEFKNIEDLLAEIGKVNVLKIKIAEMESELKTQFINHKNEIEKKDVLIQKISNDYENKISKLSSDYENSIKKIETEFQIERMKNDNEFKLKKIELDKEREVEILKTQQEVSKIRQEFLEKNYGDLKSEAGQAFDRSIKAVGVFLDKIQYKQMNGCLPSTIEQTDVNIM